MIHEPVKAKQGIKVQRVRPARSCGNCAEMMAVNCQSEREVIICFIMLPHSYVLT